MHLEAWHAVAIQAIVAGRKTRSKHTTYLEFENVGWSRNHGAMHQQTHHTKTTKLIVSNHRHRMKN